MNILKVGSPAAMISGISACRSAFHPVIPACSP